MKVYFFALLLIIGYSNCYSQSNKTELIASCCEEGRGCKGSAYSTACKNCTGCKHCAKNGGTCGVCSSSNTKKRSSYKSSTNTKLNFKKGDALYAMSNSLNLREGPGTQYKIIEKLKKHSEVELLVIKGSWLKVKVKTSKAIGYVYAKYLRLN
ncbi:SH3 domain-containing protein [Winogradskyella luteola]|uniref:SH3 domain-containing protein n=1 Tax=Winogradskyella luteola TaxID=2828330 RepID=A0A9X1F7G4_9FLAO|nr:SH3 domain-containing protein [Winogradskyella luteola]MBV7268033.1 SH3 domain-containing protein [Winogradskyella luteola]